MGYSGQTAGWSGHLGAVAALPRRGTASLQSLVWPLTRAAGYFLSSMHSSSCISNPAKLQVALAPCCKELLTLATVGRATSMGQIPCPCAEGAHHLPVPVILSMAGPYSLPFFL